MDAPANTPPRKTCLFISQVYVPDPAAVGQHVTDAAEEMARRGWRVVVMTSRRGYDDPSLRYPARETLGGVEVRRLPLSSFGKKTVAMRLVGQLLFMVQVILRGIVMRRPDVVVVSTSPPFAGLAGVVLRRLRGIPFVWWVMDINPDQLVAHGSAQPSSWLVRALDWLNRKTLAAAERVVTLDPFMKARLLEKCPVEEKLSVLPPWPHDDRLATDPEAIHAFRTRHGLDGKFVVMYSGNHALQHPLTTLLDAAASLADEQDLVFAFVGGGAGKQQIEKRIAEGAANLRSLPYQPLAAIGASLGSADVHVVTMGDDMVGIVHPCKVYGALAVGRPLLFFGPRACHVGEIMEGNNLGAIVAHGDVDAAREAVLRLRELSDEARAAIRERSGRLVRERFARSRLLGEFCDLL